MRPRPTPGARFTRRQWTALIGVAPLAAQTASAPSAASAASATPEARLAKAAEDVRRVSNRLAGLEVPMNTEPAFAFKI